MGSLYSWRRPCLVAPEVDVCQQAQAAASGGCAATATWFWIAAALVGAVALVKRKR